MERDMYYALTTKHDKTYNTDKPIERTVSEFATKADRDLYVRYVNEGTDIRASHRYGMTAEAIPAKRAHALVDAVEGRPIPSLNSVMAPYGIDNTARWFEEWRPGYGKRAIVVERTWL